MKVINILPPVIYNRLAAGEVVENPASIVKELLENSLDAHAKQISVQITNGGLDEIVVTDDGDGVAESELPKVFLPHATSKITNAEDIDHITSLGFRGEALASISAVAKVSFTSRPENQEYAVTINQDNETSYAGGNRGTTVRVANLFYNTPARKKFLRSINTEKNHVTQVVHEIVFAHPDLQLRYYVDHSLVLDYRGEGLSNLIHQIYNLDSNHLVAVNGQMDGISVNGYISDLSSSKVNKARQIVIINGRVVNGGIIATIINETMANYLPMREYPIFVLHFTILPERVDVNVHPQKREVRFDNRDQIIQFVRQTLTKTMEDYFLKQISVLTQSDAVSTEPMVTKTSVMPTPVNYEEQVNKPLPVIGHSFNPSQSETKEVVIQSLNVLADRNDLVESAPNILNHLNFSETITATQTSVLSRNHFKILGQIFETYLLVSTVDSLLIIDQHAMAERINYDKFSAEINNNSIQSQILLTPLIINVTPKELSRFIEIRSSLNDLGFDCDEFGSDMIRISAVPALMVNASLKDFMSILLNDKAVANDNLRDLIKHSVATAACKASIKAGDVLSSEQITMFLDQYFQTKNVPLCPHGRPIMMVYSRSKLESLFARK